MKEAQLAETLREHADTADTYAARADAKLYHGDDDTTFLGEHADYWRGAAATYRLVADLVAEGR